MFLAVFALLLAALPALLASNADAASSTKAKTWNVMVGAESSSGAVQTMAYGPKKIWINAGDTVHWASNSMEPHTVSFIDDKAPGGRVQSDDHLYDGANVEGHDLQAGAVPQLRDHGPGTRRPSSRTRSSRTT